MRGLVDVANAGRPRPLVGLVFGGLVYVLFESGLVGIPVPDGDEVYFFIALGFIAGFSERFAPDLVANTEQNVSRTVNPTQANATLAGGPIDEVDEAGPDMIEAPAAPKTARRSYPRPSDQSYPSR